jgi:hypothetical protein
VKLFTGARRVPEEGGRYARSHPSRYWTHGLSRGFRCVPTKRNQTRSGQGNVARFRTGDVPTYCAVCHGIDGKGKGLAAEALKVPPTDLTMLAKKYGGKYPSDHVANAISGDLRLSAHGSKEMPVWGDLFWDMSEGHGSEVQLRVTNLNKYIESLQAK